VYTLAKERRDVGIKGSPFGSRVTLTGSLLRITLSSPETSFGTLSPE
jgi:hypothetical protein